MEPFIGEIRSFAFGGEPKGWVACKGQLLPIVQNQALFTLLGTTYGGNGTSNFALPDLQGRVPVGFGPDMTIGAKGGDATVTLTPDNLPPHSHRVRATTASATEAEVSGALLARTESSLTIYAPANSAPVTINSGSVGDAGLSQPLTNYQPFLAVNWCIATNGIFPPHD